MGFKFEVAGGKVRYRYEGLDDPDPFQTLPLLRVVKAHKDEVMVFLAGRGCQAPSKTCYECPDFRPGQNSPNPTQAWGYCIKFKRGRYGVAKPCHEAV